MDVRLVTIKQNFKNKLRFIKAVLVYNILMVEERTTLRYISYENHSIKAAGSYHSGCLNIKPKNQCATCVSMHLLILHFYNL